MRTTVQDVLYIYIDPPLCCIVCEPCVVVKSSIKLVETEGRLRVKSFVVQSTPQREKKNPAHLAFCLQPACKSWPSIWPLTRLEGEELTPNVWEVPVVRLSSKNHWRTLRSRGSKRRRGFNLFFNRLERQMQRESHIVLMLQFIGPSN